MVAAVTEAVLDAEEGARPRDPARVWVFPTEVPDGTWGGAGRIVRPEDIVAFTTGDPEGAKRYADRRLGRAPEPATA